MKKKTGIISIIAVAALLISTIVGIAVYADDGDSSTKNPQSALMAKVAEILGVDQDDLENAFTQAREELRDEAVQDRLDKLVENGVLTEEEAQEYADWLDERPEDLPAILNQIPQDNVEEYVQGLIDDEKITEAEGEAYLNWLDDRPDVPDKVDRMLLGGFGRGGFSERGMMDGPGNGHDGFGPGHRVETGQASAQASTGTSY